MFWSRLQTLIADLEEVRHNRVLLYVSQDRGRFPHLLQEDDVLPLAEALWRIGPVDRIDLVLATGGGSVSVAQTICHLLRAYASQVNVLIPYKARSAGTLLCLGAQEIVMGPAAQMSPIDPLLQHAGPPPARGMPLIAAEDIRLFRQMAQTWFGLQESGSAEHLLRLLCERIFPTTLTAFFRAEQEVRAIADELLSFQLPHAAPQERQAIVERLLHGAYTHEASILRTQARQIGLQVVFASRQEEDLLWQLWQTCSQNLLAPHTSLSSQQAGESRNALIAATGFAATCRVQVLGGSIGVPGANGQPDSVLMVDLHWEQEEV
jgi:hypothetical protein